MDVEYNRKALGIIWDSWPARWTWRSGSFIFKFTEWSRIERDTPKSTFVLKWKRRHNTLAPVIVNYKTTGPKINVARIANWEKRAIHRSKHLNKETDLRSTTCWGHGKLRQHRGEHLVGEWDIKGQNRHSWEQQECKAFPC